MGEYENIRIKLNCWQKLGVFKIIFQN